MDCACGSSRATNSSNMRACCSQYQVRTDKAIRRHWQLACCAFSFCWSHGSHSSCSTASATLGLSASPAPTPLDAPVPETGARKKNQRGKRRATTRFLAGSSESSTRVAGAQDSCCDAIGMAGPNSSRLRRCNSCSDSLSRGNPLLFIVLLDPCPQTTASRRGNSPLKRVENHHGDYLQRYLGLNNEQRKDCSRIIPEQSFIMGCRQLYCFLCLLCHWTEFLWSHMRRNS
jgi:hypothetical protein